MWGEFMMNTPEATLSVIFIAIFIIEHGDKAVGTTSPGPANATCTEPTKGLLRVTTNKPVPMATKNLLLQDPRFVGVKKGRNISIQCGCRSNLSIDHNITWYLGYQNGSFISYLELDKHIKIEDNKLFIKKVHKNHNGIYFCNITTDGLNRVPCGTELMVLGSGNQATSESRNRMKDAIIMIQTILIVLFTTVPVLLLMEMKKKRTLKIEDHTYEGLEAYQSPTYEDIQTVRVLASKTMEGEHPCLE
ncbi:B-cell antigen receptor complex-associated protein beta chain [Rana temporaria]|uniref:B-cell antigen receptor complex-associated protein beta chain n=1 Tax=Rana temporaria TaxID=8407 RepID=UPI001AACD0CC|nr:B-cell antigen receptor complex-associated protein beta chain [Rana temporaria]